MLLQQHPEHIFSRHVALCAFLKDFQDLQPGQRGLEAGALEFFDVGHGKGLGLGGAPRLGGACRYNGLHHILWPFPMSANAFHSARLGRSCCSVPAWLPVAASTVRVRALPAS
jgi:hypothetical protein